MAESDWKKNKKPQLLKVNDLSTSDSGVCVCAFSCGLCAPFVSVSADSTGSVCRFLFNSDLPLSQVLYPAQEALTV